MKAIYYRGAGDRRHVRILKGSWQEPLIIEKLDGMQYEMVKHDIIEGRSPDICQGCAFSDKVGECSPVHRCRPGNNINIILDGTPKEVGVTQWHISWREIIINPVDKIDVIQVEL